MWPRSARHFFGWMQPPIPEFTPPDVDESAPDRKEAVLRNIVPSALPPRSGARTDETDADGRPNWYADGNLDTFPGADFGIALSGGGIRSASFSTGVLQALAGSRGHRNDDWSLENADYLATVSGGGYLGISTQMLHHANRGDGRIAAYEQGSPEFTWLRENHRYIGHGTALGRSLFTLLGASVANLATIVGTVYLLGYWVGRLWQSVPLPAGHGPWWVPALVAAAVLGTFMRELLRANGLLAGRGFRGATAARVAGGGLVFVSFVAAVATVTAAPVTVLVTLAGLSLLGLGSTRAARRTHPPRRDILRFAGRSAFELAWLVAAWAVAALGAATWFGAGSGLLAEHPWILSVATAGLVTMLLLMDQSLLSPHRFYKERLSSTFAVERGSRDRVGHIPYETPTRLDEWAKPYPADGKNGPELLVCATANVEDLSIPPSGERSVPFVFAHDHVGSPELGFWTTSQFVGALGRRLAPDGTLQAAMAVSGAAIASGMGARARIPTAGRFVVLANLRLGVWLPNPRARSRWPSEKTLRGRWVRRRRGSWLVREVLGSLPGRKRYVYVSDGGHLDNLGLLELVRRRCATILVADASGDCILATNTLDEVLALACRHFHIEVLSRSDGVRTGSHRGLFDLRSDRVTEDCVETIVIRYPAVGPVPSRIGRIVFAKATFADTLADDPDARSAARRVTTDFRSRLWPGSARTVPKTTTVNQILSDTVFDAYVELGRAVGRVALRRLSASTTASLPTGTTVFDPTPLSVSEGNGHPAAPR